MNLQTRGVAVPDSAIRAREGQDGFILWARSMSLFSKKSPDQPAGLISVLRDARLDDADRDDAAMDLRAFDEPEVRSILSEVATDPVTDPDLADTAAESLAEIWCRTKSFDVAVYRQLTGGALAVATAMIAKCHPEWLVGEEGSHVLRITNAVFPWKQSAVNGQRERLLDSIVSAVPFTAIVLDRWNDDLQAELSAISPPAGDGATWYRIRPADVERLKAESYRGLWALFAFSREPRSLSELDRWPDDAETLARVTREIGARYSIVADVDEQDWLVCFAAD